MTMPASAAALMGAFVADAAALGLHWIYDPERIAAVAARENGAAFVPIAASNYADVPAYFAHAQRQNGMLSQYGECLRLAVDVINANAGHFAVSDYQQAFANHFGMGGTYVGYIDRPTRAAVNHIDANENPSGSDDDQLPALTRLPAVIAALHGQEGLDTAVEEAVRITNINPDATRYAKVFATLLRAVLSGQPLSNALSAAANCADANTREALTAAIETPETDSVAYGEITERACHLYQGMPLAFHILAKARDYRDAVTRNIAAGGDSCGRAIVIGATLGAAHGLEGIPPEWLLKLHQAEALMEASAQLAKAASTQG